VSRIATAPDSHGREQPQQRAASNRQHGTWLPACRRWSSARRLAASSAGNIGRKRGHPRAGHRSRTPLRRGPTPLPSIPRPSRPLLSLHRGGDRDGVGAHRRTTSSPPPRCRHGQLFCVAEQLPRPGRQAPTTSHPAARSRRSSSPALCRPDDRRRPALATLPALPARRAPLRAFDPHQPLRQRRSGNFAGGRLLGSVTPPMPPCDGCRWLWSLRHRAATPSTHSTWPGSRPRADRRNEPEAREPGHVHQLAWRPAGGTGRR